MLKIEELEGKTFKDVCDMGDDTIRFYLEDKGYYEMRHNQDCCESVTLEDIAGTLEDLIGSPIIVASETSNHLDTGVCESETWTFYNIGTVNGWVTLRWYGESNGYYSEDVDLYWIPSQ